MLQHHFNETLLNVALNSLTSSLCCLGLPKSSSLIEQPLNCSEIQSTPNLNVHSFLAPTAASAAASLTGPNSEDRIIAPKNQPVHRFDCSSSPDSQSQLPYYKYSCQSKLALNLTEKSECDFVAASATATAASFPATSDLVLASSAIFELSPMNPECNSYPEPIHPYSNSFFSNSSPPNGLGVDVDHERLVEASGFDAYHPRNRRHLYGTSPSYWERRLTSPQSTTLIPSDNNHCDNKKTKTSSAKIVKRNRTGKRKRKLLAENRCQTKVNNNNNSAVNSNFYSANPVSQLRNCSQLQNNNSSGDVLLKKSYYQTKKDCAIGVDENEGAPEEEPEEDEDEMETDDGPVNDEDHSTELNLIMMLKDQQSSDNELSHGVTNPLVGDKRILHEMDNTVAYDPHYYHHYPMPNYPPACVVAPVPPSSYPSTPRHYQQYFNGTGGGSNSPMTAATGASSIQPSSGTPPQSTLNLSPSSPVTTTTTHIQPNSGNNHSNSFDPSQSSTVNPQSHSHSHLLPHPESHHLSHLHLYSDPANPHHPSLVNQSHCIKSDPCAVEPTKSHPLELSSSSSSPPPSLHFNDKVCYGCRQTLSTSPIIASVSGYHKWHTNCLCCSECSQSLSQSRSCYIRNGRIYCKSDYIKLIKCSKCYRQISASDWVRRAGELVYHLACFACDLCQRQLSTGEKFTIEKQTATESRLLCKLHFGIKNEEETSPKHELNTSDLDHSSSSNAASNISNSSPGNLKSSSSLNPVTTPTGLGGQLRGQGSMDNLSVRSSSGMSSSSKSKRVRTTFTEEQLSVLQANFQLDSNPDGQDLERIASLTGLSKRVTQVWFQNSRARQKKYMSRSQRHSGMLGPNGGSSTPPVSLLTNGGRSNGVGDLWSPSSSMCSSNTGLNSDNASPMDPLSATNGSMLDSISINLPPSNGNAGAGSAGSATSAAVNSIAAAIAVSNGVNGNVNGTHNAPKWASLGVIDHSNASQYSESEHSSCSPSTAHM